MLFDEGAAQTAGSILTRDRSIDPVWRELDPFLEIKKSLNLEGPHFQNYLEGPEGVIFYP